MEVQYKSEDINTVDGVKIDFEHQWVHLRKSNTEPIIRIYTESNSQQSADELAERFITEITEIIT
jgi:phosphomannomutase